MDRQSRDMHAGDEMGAGPATGHQAHDKHTGHDPEVFRRQFWVVLVLTIPVVVWSREVQDWLGHSAPTFVGSVWIPPVLGTVVFGYGGRVFVAGAASELP
jgi:Cu2+-exporting ATPase